jgi:hypothetical protein
MNPLKGQCYILSELLYHVLGGKDAGWKPMYMQVDKIGHWFLRHDTGLILDITASQFGKKKLDYSKAIGKGFLTRRPCNRTMELVDKIL